MNLICFILYGVASVCFVNLFTPFIELCFGEKFVLPIIVVLLISVNNFLVGLNLAPITIQSAAGLYNNDRYVPIIQSIVNIVISVALVFPLGIAGVLLGTLISQFIPIIVKPVIAYRHVFNENVMLYFKNLAKQLLLLFMAIGLSFGLTTLIGSHGYILDFAIGLVISLVITLPVMYLGYRRTREFKDLKGRILFMIDKIKNSRRKAENNG